MTPIVILNKKKNGICIKNINGKNYTDTIYTFGCLDNGIKKVVEVLAYTAKEARQKIKEGKYIKYKQEGHTNGTN